MQKKLQQQVSSLSHQLQHEKEKVEEAEREMLKLQVEIENGRKILADGDADHKVI